MEFLNADTLSSFFNTPVIAGIVSATVALSVQGYRAQRRKNEELKAALEAAKSGHTPGTKTQISDTFYMHSEDAPGFFNQSIIAVGDSFFLDEVYPIIQQKLYINYLLKARDHCIKDNNPNVFMELRKILEEDKTLKPCERDMIESDIYRGWIKFFSGKYNKDLTEINSLKQPEKDFTVYPVLSYEPSVRSREFRVLPIFKDMAGAITPKVPKHKCQIRYPNENGIFEAKLDHPQAPRQDTLKRLISDITQHTTFAQNIAVDVYKPAN